MPLKSKAQERYLWAVDPKAAKKMEADTTKKQRANLPEAALALSLATSVCRPRHGVTANGKRVTARVPCTEWTKRSR